MYGACNLKGFKRKLKCYEAIQKKSSKQKFNVRSTKDNKTGVKSEKAIICYNCGDKGYTSKNSKDKEKGIKCFSCNKFGNISKECLTKVEKANIWQFEVGNITTVITKLDGYISIRFIWIR